MTRKGPKKFNTYIVYSRDKTIHKQKKFSGVGVGVKHATYKGIPVIEIKTRHGIQRFASIDYGLEIIPAGSDKPLNPTRVFKPMPRGRPKKGTVSKKKELLKTAGVNVNRKPAYNTGKSLPTSTINMHGTLYRRHSDRGLSKQEAQRVAESLRNQGYSAFLNPQKRKSGTTYWVYVKKSERAKKGPSSKKSISTSKRTGTPTKTINMHGKEYHLHDAKPRTKGDAQAIRIHLKAQGYSSFLNPRKRKSGTDYFIYKKKAEKRTSKPGTIKKVKGRKSTYHVEGYTLKELEAELKALKARK